ncbi:helix-turn-helix domain-containing protein [Actinobacteria bacterium YIM 96077]|uniref:AfsR/SARP family transcriptional regulator n=1 Tax=Phytoactinopolyspora halophila TaxID=1981511 RepID=A0A329QT08_9ACTN|nr:BTAD domain-containing putative transcriptional regulator [Phytoactinopolyspora halophila]AYY14988.1 helix-turn-helix domain-containing protein [Actinobacteria bacterium YIM 96077]RAW15445.1 hypothetical protein DPM12_09365 [Phytoactinopolyspora halophila]
MAHPEPDRPAVDIRVLGSLDVTVGGQPIRLAGRRTRGLLALLARRPGQPVCTSEVLQQVWDETSSEAPGETARNAVQARISALRRALGSHLLRATDTGYVLDVPPDAVDAVRFETAVREARELRAASAVERASAAYAEALGQWHGERAYVDLQHVAALVEEADRLGELRLQVLQESLALEVEQGRYDQVADTLVDATRRHPGVEELWALRMLGLYGQGRQAEAMAVYVEARRQLRERFGLDPSPRLRELEAMVLHQKDPRDGGLRFLGPARIARPATSFVGRQGDLDRVTGLLRSTRMLTLTGAGGVGKTRLALEAAQELVDGCSPVAAHGVTVVDLIGYRRGDDLAAAVLDALGPVVPSSSSVGIGRGARRSVDVLCDVLSDRRLLLIMDNCEHLTDDTAALAAELLSRTTAISVLATSREALNVPGEVVYVVDPLPVPESLGSASGADADVGEAPAVRLFLDRVRASQPGIELDTERIRTVADICQRLDGLPLALELAAVRIRVLGVDEVDRLLDDRFAFLRYGARTAAERHRTLQAVVDWSYELLEEQDRRVFEALSVFRGSFALRQVQDLWVRLGGTERQALDSVESLVARSMVQAEADRDGENRFRLLETMRAYAAEKLSESGRERQAVITHARVYAQFAREQMGALKTARQARAVATLMREDANIRTAHGHAIDVGLGDVAQTMVGALGYIAWMREGRAPGWDLIVRSLRLPATDPQVRIPALAWATHLGSIFGHAAEAVDYGEQASELAAAHPGCCTPDVAFAMLARAHALHRLGRWAEGDAQLSEARQVAVADGDAWTRAGCAMVKGLGALVRGRLAEAEAQFVEAGDLYRACQDQWGQQRSALRRAIVRGAYGDHAGAAQLLREAVAFIDGLELAEAAAPARVALARATLFAGDVSTARNLVEMLEGGIIGRLSDAAGRIRQCRAVLAEYDGRADDAADLHRSAARRLLDAGLPVEAVESLARVVVLAGAHSVDARAAAEEAEAAATGSPDPRVQATVLDVRALVGEGSAAETARAVRDKYGLAVPALLRERPWDPRSRDHVHSCTS